MRGLGALGALASLLLLALPGCGGGGGGSTTSASTSTPTPGTQRSARSAERAKPQGQKSHPSSQTDPHPTRQSAPEGAPLPGSKAVAPGVPVQKGGDNSIQSFGAEGQQAERSQAFGELHAYLGALRGGQWARACALASTQLRGELAKLLAHAKVRGKGKKPEGCAGTLQALLGKASPQALHQLTQIGELLSFRVEAPYAYLIFKGAKGRPMFIAMATEEGKWRVNVPKPEEFGASQGASR